MAVQATLDVPPQTQDGGNFSDTKAQLLLMKEERFWKS
jgi:hypothetical protein